VARPRSDEKRAAILEAATTIIVERGLSAPTASIAKLAGVANGSFFTYFETKSDLFNQLYLELKKDMAAAIMKDFPVNATLRDQTRHVWQAGTNFAMASPHKRRAMVQLAVSDEITPQTRAAAEALARGFGQFVTRLREHGSLRNVPITFAGSIMNALSEATIEAMVKDPDNAQKHCETGFEAFWRAIS